MKFSNWIKRNHGHFYRVLFEGLTNERVQQINEIALHYKKEIFTGNSITESDGLKRGDMVRYIGGKNTSLLKVNEIYRVSSPVRHKKISVNCDNGKSIQVDIKFFTHV